MNPVVILLDMILTEISLLVSEDEFHMKKSAVEEEITL